MPRLLPHLFPRLVVSIKMGLIGRIVTLSCWLRPVALIVCPQGVIDVNGFTSLAQFASTVGVHDILYLILEDQVFCCAIGWGFDCV